MKYLFLALISVLICGEASAAKFPMVTLTADGTQEIAVIPRAGGMWEATVITSGDFGSGTLTLHQATTSTCTTTRALKDSAGTAYSSTDDDTLNIKLGVDKDNYTYLCATLAGATNPDIDVEVYDNR